MMKTILVLTDFSRASKRAADWAIDIAMTLNAEILLLHSYHLPQIIVARVPQKDYLELEAQGSASLEKEMIRLLKKINDKNIERPIKIRSINTIGPVSEVLYDIQQSGEIILTVMGRHSALKTNFLSTNHIHIALRNSNCPLLIVATSPFGPSGLRVNLASDLDSRDLSLIRHLLAPCKSFHCSLSVSHVLTGSGFVADFNEEDKLKAFSLALNTKTFNGIKLHLLEGRSVVDEIAKLNRTKGFGLLIVVNRGHHPLHELFNASHNRAFIKKQKGSILVLPEDWNGRRCKESAKIQKKTAQTKII